LEATRNRLPKKMRDGIILVPWQQIAISGQSVPIFLGSGVATIQDEMGHIASDHNSYISANSKCNGIVTNAPAQIP
jgi:hypothetical protein